MIKITFETNSIEEAHDLLHKLSAQDTVKHEVTDVSETAGHTEAPAEQADVKPASKKKRSKKKTAKKNSDAEEKAPEDAPAGAATAKDVQASLKKIGEKFGFDRVRQICNDFGANALRDLDEAHYDEVVARCESELAVE